MIKIIFILFLNLVFTFCYASPYKWESKENNVTITQKISMDGQSVAQVLNLEYSATGKCNIAFVSITWIPHMKALGKRTKEDIYESSNKGNKLFFFVDDKEIKYQQEKIMKVEFENGVQFGTLSPPSLIKALEKSNGKIEVFLGQTKMIRIPSSVGFGIENKNAYKYCLKNKR